MLMAIVGDCLPVIVIDNCVPMSQRPAVDTGWSCDCLAAQVSTFLIAVLFYGGLSSYCCVCLCLYLCLYLSCSYCWLELLFSAVVLTLIDCRWLLYSRLSLLCVMMDGVAVVFD